LEAGGDLAEVHVHVASPLAEIGYVEEHGTDTDSGADGESLVQGHVIAAVDEELPVGEEARAHGPPYRSPEHDVFPADAELLGVLLRLHLRQAGIGEPREFPDL